MTPDDTCSPLTDLLDKLERFAIEYGHECPDPDDLRKINETKEAIVKLFASVGSALEIARGSLSESVDSFAKTEAEWMEKVCVARNERDAAADWGADGWTLVNLIADALKVPCEPHQTVQERLLETAERAGKSTDYAVSLEAALREVRTIIRGRIFRGDTIRASGIIDAALDKAPKTETEIGIPKSTEGPGTQASSEGAVPSPSAHLLAIGTTFEDGIKCAIDAVAGSDHVENIYEHVSAIQRAAGERRGHSQGIVQRDYGVAFIAMPGRWVLFTEPEEDESPNGFYIDEARAETFSSEPGFRPHRLLHIYVLADPPAKVVPAQRKGNDHG